MMICVLSESFENFSIILPSVQVNNATARVHTKSKPKLAAGESQLFYYVAFCLWLFFVF